MKFMKKIILTVAAAALLLSGCATSAESKLLDYGNVDGYYSRLAYEVKSDSGEIAEQTYVLFSDSEMEDVAGKKDVYYEDGEMIKYTVTIGTEEISELITYNSGEGEKYYSEVYFSDGDISKEVWDNEVADESGDKIRMTGHQEYFPESRSIKSFFQEIYREGSLESTTTREYDENGEIVSESVE